MFFIRKKYKNLPDDRELLEKYRMQGDMSCIGILFEKYVHLVFGVCLKYLKDPDDSKDAVSQIFEKVISETKKKEILNFEAWLHTVTRNYCLMTFRNNKNNHVSVNEEKIEEVIEQENEEFLPDPEVMKNAMENLKESQRICLQLFYFDELSYNQLAEKTGYSIGEVKSYIQNGKRNLKLMLQQNENRSIS
ncbi:MAG: sigma-70 family RNA polymerase sigma factor [Bacteroidota bacterium]